MEDGRVETGGRIYSDLVGSTRIHSDLVEFGRDESGDWRQKMEDGRTRRKNCKCKDV
jgi:hypothetical protein